MTTLNNILLKHLKENQGWHKKVHLYLVADEAGYSPETAGRCLRDLAEKGEIHVEYYPGVIRKTQLAKYCYDKPVELKRVIKIIDGKAVETFI